MIPKPLLLAGGLLLTPEAAAHSPFPGIKGLYSGFLHPLTQPAPSMLLIAAALLLASCPEPRRPAAAGVLVAAAAGGLLTGAAAAGADHTLLLSALVLVTALPVLLRCNLPGWLLIGLAAAAGGVLGMACAPDPGAWQDVVITSFGAWLGLVYFAAMATGAMVAVQRRWYGQVLDVATRIVAAWLMTVALLYATLWWYAPSAGQANRPAAREPAGDAAAGPSIATRTGASWNTGSSANSRST